VKYSQTLVEMARRHVREGEGRLQRQAAMVTTLELHGYSEAATQGRRVLETMRVSLDMAKRHFLDIAAKTAAAP
jgi:hypothetical protein